MTRKPNGCLEIEPDLVAAATGDAEPGASRRVEHHIDSCGACRREARTKLKTVLLKNVFW